MKQNEAKWKTCKMKHQATPHGSLSKDILAHMKKHLASQACDHLTTTPTTPTHAFTGGWTWGRQPRQPLLPHRHLGQPSFPAARYAAVFAPSFGGGGLTAASFPTAGTGTAFFAGTGFTLAFFVAGAGGAAWVLGV